MYWNIKAEVACPRCGKVEERELQTHWMGEIGSCLNHYRLGEKVEELKGVTAAVLDGTNDDFITNCREGCGESEWVRCGYCEGTGTRPNRPGWRRAGEYCDRCTEVNEVGEYGWHYRSDYFLCGGRIENEAVVEVWPIVHNPG